MVTDRVQQPRGTNERDLDVARDTSGVKSPVGYYHAEDMPGPATTEPLPTNHRAAVERARLLETRAQAEARRASGGPPPPHYIPLRTRDE